QFFVIYQNGFFLCIFADFLGVECIYFPRFEEIGMLYTYIVISKLPTFNTSSSLTGSINLIVGKADILRTYQSDRCTLFFIINFVECAMVYLHKRASCTFVISTSININCTI